jgi:hypothetical protein
MFKKYEFTPALSEKIFKIDWSLSDARRLVRTTRLGFRLSEAVSPPYKALPLTRFPAAGPASPALLFPRFLAARSRAERVPQCFLSFRELSAATGPGFFYPPTLLTKYYFQQSRAVNFISSESPIKQDFSFTPSGLILPNSHQQIQIIGPVEDREVSNSIADTTKGEVE